MMKDECSLNPETIRKLINYPLPGSIMNLESLYDQYEKTAWHLKTVVGKLVSKSNYIIQNFSLYTLFHFKFTADGRELGEELANSEILSTIGQQEEINFQKKINPWKLLSVSQEIEEYAGFNIKKKCVAEEGLVVVASLLGHFPNLGGLCRTCEIFGVNKYVVSSLKVVSDQQFQNLSVSSQNWVNILEV